MSTKLNEIQLRLHKRIEAEEAVRKMKPPHLLSIGAKKAFDEVYKEMREDYLDACLMETHDMRFLIALIEELRSVGVNIDMWEDLVWTKQTIDADLQDALDALEAKEAAAREKAAKSDKQQGELEGQQKLEVNGGKFKVKDDGSEAEPASECTVTRVDPEQIDEALATKAIDEHEKESCISCGEPFNLADAALDELLDDLVKPDLLEQVKSADLLDAVIVLNHHFEKVCGHTTAGAQVLTDRAIARWVAVPKDEPRCDVPPEHWDEPQRKEPESAPEADPLTKAVEKKRATKKGKAKV